MKKLLTLFFMLALVLSVFAQAPQKFTYQAVVRDNSNNLLRNTDVTVTVSLLQGSESGSAVYVETHNAKTNANGLMTLLIGGGTVTSGSFAGIEWGSGPYFVRVESNLGDKGTLTTVQQLLSVPYAQYANETGNYTETDPTVPAWAKEPAKPNYNYSEIKNTPELPTVPTKVSQLENDKGYLTSYSETDPTVPAWAKESAKPNYDYSEIKNTPTIPTLPTKVSAFDNDAHYLTEEAIPTEVSSFNNDSGYLTEETDPTVPAWAKESAKPNYNYSEIKNTPTLATVATSGSYNDLKNKPTIPTVPTKVSQLENDANYLKAETDPTVPAWAKESSKPNYDYSEIKNTPTIPTVPTKVSAFENDKGYLTSYTETDPTVPAWAKESAKPNYDYSEIQNTPTLATVATSGKYSDLQNTPTIPTVNDATLTIQQNGSEVGSFSANQSSDQTVNIATLTAEDVQALINSSLAPMQEQLDTLKRQNDALQEQLDNTSFVCEGKVKDYDGNEYNVVHIGSQCWLKENLRTEHYADGTKIDQGTATSTTVGYWYYPNGEASKKSTYGLLYNWVAAMNGASSSDANPSGVQGICPNGWHMPSQTEWTQLKDYVSSQSKYVCGGEDILIAKALAAATTDWEESYGSCDVGYAPENNNATGFSVLPAGTEDDGPWGFGGYALHWSTTESSSVEASSFGLAYSGGYISFYDGRKYIGYAVRCLRETSSTGSLNDILESLQSQNNAMQQQLDTMQQQIDSLQSQNDAMQEQLDNANFVCGTTKVKDYDGNEYNTVRIGNQCWLQENLRTEHYADGTKIEQGTENSTTEGHWYFPYDDASQKPTHGLLYNFPAVMNGAENSEANPSGVQGLCPNGWHVPSQAEWTQLRDYVGSQSQYVCGLNNLSIGRALAAATTEWLSSTAACSPGIAPEHNNATGFSALPTHNGSSFNTAHFWDATQYDNVVWSDWDRFTASTALVDKDKSYSVRCVRDNSALSTGEQLQNMNEQFEEMQDEMNDMKKALKQSNVCGYATVKDFDGNEYNTVKIGTQCWMKENLRTKHYADGTQIEEGASTSTTDGYWYYPNGSASNETTYGLLYNWAAVMSGAASSEANPSGVQGLCPNGWHLPSDAEWEQLTDYVSSRSEYLCGDNSENIAKALASTTGWLTNTNECAVGNGQEDNNATGFSALPAGDYFGSYVFFGYTANFWSATEYVSNSDCAQYFQMFALSAPVSRSYYSKYVGMSVRCVQDASVGDKPNNVCGYAKVTDYDGNEYSTVQIGTQCWMKENLRTEHYADGTKIDQGTSTSTTEGFWYYPDNNSSNKATYGLLYNWKAVMRNSSSSSGNTSGVQGVCPNGWHVPSDAEWTQLTDYVRSQSKYQCNSNSENIAKALASTSGWETNTEECAIGNGQSGNNSTGFSAVPAGNYYDSYYNFDRTAFFWSATEYDSNKAYFRGLYYDYANVSRTYNVKYSGYSVRCVRN